MRNQPVVSAETFGEEQNLSPIQIPMLSKDMDEQLELAHRIVDVVNYPNGKIRSAMLQYNVAQRKSSNAQIRMFARKREDEKLQQIFYVNYEA